MAERGFRLISRQRMESRAKHLSRYWEKGQGGRGKRERGNASYGVYSAARRVNIAGIRAIACRLSDQTRAAAEGKGKTGMSLSRFRLSSDR